jgi:hypothetical protein
LDGSEMDLVLGAPLDFVSSVMLFLLFATIYAS